MNYCRTCKHWAVNANKIGFGSCINLKAHLHQSSIAQSYETAQNFGCPCHDRGDCFARIYPPEEELLQIRAFLKDRHNFELKQAL
jgi:hypothetical protein